MINGMDRLDKASCQMLTAARRYAAVLGNFEPLALMQHLGAAADQSEEQKKAALYPILDLLSVVCDEIEDDGAVLWRMQPTARSAILADLKKNGELETIAAGARALASDSFGAILSSISAGQDTFAKPTDDIAALGALETALHYAGAPEARREVQARIQREETKEAFDFILPGELIGRESELSELGEFIYKGGPPSSQAPKLFLLTGSGGAGKSALLAALARAELKKGAQATPIVWLDLDRPLLGSTDPVSLMLEFARQLALFWPEQRSHLDQFRAELSQASSLETQGIYRTETLISTAFSIWRETLEAVLPIDRPIVIIIDTFEEVLVHGAWNADRVDRWINGLAAEGGLTSLRPILSGRAFENLWRRAVSPLVAGEIDLEGLPAGAAQDLLAVFLRFRGADAGQFALNKLAAQFGGNPLVLKILAQYLADEGPSAQQDLLEGDAVGGLRDELAQQFLYTRILGRIRTDNEDLVKLAFPGLALRRITADLIHDVLATPCQIKVRGREAAQTLLEDLAKQIWLIEPDGDPHVIRHRRDLRRLMLKGIPSAKEDAVRDIHRRAADYYARRQDPRLSDAAQFLECQYHVAMAGAVPRELGDPEAARIFLDTLGEDAGSLPTAVLARIKYNAERALAVDEAATLADDERTQIKTEDVLQSLRAGYRAADVDADWQSSSVEAHAADAFLLGDWAQLIALAEAAFRSDFVSALGRRQPPDAFTHCASWRVTMAAVSCGKQHIVSESLRAIVDQHPGIMSSRRSFTRAKDGPLQLEVLTAISYLLGSGDDYSPLPIRTRGLSMPTIDDLRLGQIIPRASPDMKIRLSLGLVRNLQRETVTWLGDEVHYFADGSSDIADWQHRVLGRARPPLDQILSLSRLGDVQPYGFHRPHLSKHCLLRELYLPIEYCAARVPDAILLETATRIGERAFAWPIELSGNELTQNLRIDRKRWTSTLVELADRAGALDVLVRSMKPHVSSAQNILQLIGRYGDRLSELERDPNQ